MLINALNPPPSSTPAAPSATSSSTSSTSAELQQRQQRQQHQQLSLHLTDGNQRERDAATYAAVGDLDDDEDAGGHTLGDTVRAALNRRDALRQTLRATQGEKTYALVPEEQRPGQKMPFMMHRERGLHLDEREFTVDGVPVCAAVLGTALTCYYAGAEHARRGEGCFFYIPKTESAAEVAIYRDLFTACAELIPHLRVTSLVPEYTATREQGDWLAPAAAPQHRLLDGDLSSERRSNTASSSSVAAVVPLTIIRAIVLIESLPAVWEMEEMLYALGPYAAGLNAARWDLKASLLEYTMGDSSAVWPDRFGVDIKSTPFLAGIFRRQGPGIPHIC